MLKFLRTAKLFKKVAVTFYFPTSDVWEFSFLHFLDNMLLSVFLITAILVSVEWYVIVVLICISLMTNDAEYIFMCILSIHVSLKKSLLFNFLSIFKLNCLFIFVL